MTKPDTRDDDKPPVVVNIFSFQLTLPRFDLALSDFTKAVAGLVAAGGIAGGAVVVSGVFDSSNPCPEGWSDTSVRDEHTLIYACERDGWLVVLNPDGTFSHGLQLDPPGADFVFRAEDGSIPVPGWPGQ